MKLFEFINKLFAKPSGKTAQQPAPQSAPAQKSASNTAPSINGGERKRHSFTFQPVHANSTFQDTTETWQQAGNLLEGSTVEMLAITASGQIVQAKELKCICSICHHAEDEIIRSDISQRILCRTCQRKFTAPDGKELTVSPDEHARLTQEFNTWEHFDRMNPQPTNRNA